LDGHSIRHLTMIVDLDGMSSKLFNAFVQEF
jgi:hypothetical protein